MTEEERTKAQEEILALLRAKQSVADPLTNFFDLTKGRLMELSNFACSKISPEAEQSLRSDVLENGLAAMQEELVYYAKEFVPKDQRELQKKDANIFQNTLTGLSDVRKNLFNCFIDDVKVIIPEELKREHLTKGHSDIRGLDKFNYYNFFLRYEFSKEERLAWTKEIRPKTFTVKPRKYYKEKQDELLQGYWPVDNTSRVLYNQERHWNDADGGKGYYSNVGRNSPEDPVMKSKSLGSIFVAVSEYIENMYFVIGILQTWQDTFNFEVK